MFSFRLRVLFILCVSLAMSGMGIGLSAETATPLPVADSAVQDAPQPIDLPGDDRVHDEPLEWWYFTGHLKTEDGSQYGFEFVFFRGAIGQLLAYVSHTAVTDHQTRQFVFDQKAESGEASIEGATGQLAVALDNWSMTIDEGIARLETTVGDYALSLQVTPTKPAALHGGDGYLQYDDDTWSNYYSRTRNDLSGTLTVRGDVQEVTGTAWFDHQWGAIDTFSEGGWDWFSIQLDDATEIMAYVLYIEDRQIERVDVTIVEADGMTTWLGEDEISISATGEWLSPSTGITWPSGWEISVPARDLSLTLTPVLLDQELDTTATTGVIYWEGAVTIEGTVSGNGVAGVGYVELTGYESGD